MPPADVYSSDETSVTVSLIARTSVDPTVRNCILPHHMISIMGADGKEYGPVSIDQINGWIGAGRANLQTKARRTGETEWKTLGDFPEFNSPPVLASSQPASEPVVTSVATAPTFSPYLASRWLRLGARLLDSLVAGLFVMPGFFVLISAGVLSTPNQPNTPLLLGGFAIMGATLMVLLGIQIYLLVKRGQTIGKKLLGLKIVNHEDGANPGFVKVFLLRVFVNALIGVVPPYSIVDILFIFRDDQRCIHDLLAGTVVVKS